MKSHPDNGVSGHEERLQAPRAESLLKLRASYTFLRGEGAAGHTTSSLRATGRPVNGRPVEDGAGKDESAGQYPRPSRHMAPIPPPPGQSRLRIVSPVVYRVCDSVTPLLAMLSVLLLLNLDQMPRGVESFLAVRLSLKNLLLLTGFILSWRVICRGLRLYDPSLFRAPRQELLRLLAAAGLGSCVALSFTLTSVSGAFDFPAWLIFTLGTALGLPASRVIIRAFAATLPVPVSNVLIVGSGPRALTLADRLSADPERIWRVLGFVDRDPDRIAVERRPLFVNLEDLQSTLLHSPVDEVMVALPMKSQYGVIQHVIETCERAGVPVTIPRDPFRSSRSSFRPSPTSVLAAVTLADPPNRHRLLLKRAFDLVGGVAALVLFAPLMLLTALAIRLTSAGPALFVQERFGYNRRLFRMYKFRTMVADAEKMLPALEHLNEAPGPLFKIHSDPRLTAIGKFLRRSSIDELPQLLNVLLGEMSLVGPRPMAVRDASLFTEADLIRRFSVYPGMTGLWQVCGRSGLDYRTWAKLDLQYADGWSLVGDLRILLQTVPAVLRGTGAE
jgi:exopolysaccharide biosynthesis polyprenyl glycosylphosphotransferase